MLAVLLLTSSAPVASAVFEDGPGTELPLVHEETYEDGVALGLRFDLSEPGTYRIDVVGHPPRTSTPVGTGILSFEQDRDYRSGFFVTGFESIDRQIVHLDGPASPQDESPDEPGVTVGPHTALAAGEGSADAKKRCPLMCTVLLQGPENTQAGPNYHVFWLGGVSRADLRVFAGSAVEDVEIVEGRTHVFGDAELDGGQANVQVQRPAPAAEEAAVGAKLVGGASESRTVDSRLWGLWDNHHEKQVCQFEGVFVCAGMPQVHAACRALSPVPCEHARISYEGPSGSATSADGFTFRGADPGTWRFTVDRKADAYAGPVAVEPTGTELQTFEHHSYLNAADVPLPPPPDPTAGTTDERGDPP